jgi:hypothetical protein
MTLILGSCLAIGRALALLAFVTRSDGFLISGCILIGATVIAMALDRSR